MIKRTLCFTNPAYLSLKDRQMVIRLPEVEKSDMPDARMLVLWCLITSK